MQAEAVGEIARVGGFVDDAVERGLATVDTSRFALRGVLNGSLRGPKREAVLLNAAAALLVADRVRSLPEGVAEAEIMNRVMADHMGREALWLETRSRNTFENARLSATMLARYDIDTVILVTHALHMKRAALAFEKYRVNVIPAPTYFHSERRIGSNYLDFFPTVSALEISYSVFREVLGMLWFLYAGTDGVEGGG